MSWLKVFIVYYILIYLLLGRIAVDIFGLTTWAHMVGLLVGCCLGHYLGKIDQVGYR